MRLMLFLGVTVSAEYSYKNVYICMLMTKDGVHCGHGGWIQKSNVILLQQCDIYTFVSNSSFTFGPIFHFCPVLICYVLSMNQSF